MSTREFCVSVKTDSRDFKKLVKEVEKINKHYSDEIGPVCGLFAALKAKNNLNFAPVLFGIQTESKHLRAGEEIVYIWGERGYVDSIFTKFKGFEAGSGLDEFLKGIVNEDSYFKGSSAQNEHFLYSEIKDNKIAVPFSEQSIQHNSSVEENQDEIIIDASKSFDKQVDDVLSGADMNISHLEVLKVTPPLLRMVGVPNLPILMTAKHLRTITQDGGTESANYHGLGAELVKRLPELISDPVMIMDSISPDDKAKNSIVIVTQMVDKENRPVIGAIMLNGVGRQDSKVIGANILTSAYGKKNFQSFIERNIEQGSVLYVDKEKSQALSVNPGIQFPDVMASLSFDTIIRKTNAFVNSKEEKKPENTEKNEGSMIADTNNANAQSARERVLKVRDDMVKTLLEHIEKNPTDWQSGWNNIAAGAPYNGKTSTAYRGLNALYLAFLGAERGYKDTRWVTFNQAKELGASVKKGEKSAPVIFFEFYDRKTKKAFDNRTVKDMTEEEKVTYLKENVYAVMRYSSVFNAEQCHNFPERKEMAMSEEERAKQNAKIETIIANSAAPVRYDGGTRAYYSSGTDSIHLPAIAAFDTMQDYYATALHEIAHSTGHESRLNRDLSGGFGSESYAKEELRAELACVFMQIEQGIQINGKHITNHAAYLNSWLAAAKNDTSVFFKAAADAQKIADYVADNYLQAADSAVIEEENVDQEHPERNPMAEYLRAETKKRAEEIDKFQEKVREYGIEVATKLDKARAEAQQLAMETGEPYVTIEWTEKSGGFPDLNAYDVMSLSEADEKLKLFDMQATGMLGYIKTKLHIDFVFEGKPESYENCRFDIGSENGGLVHHIDEYLKNEFFAEEDRAEADALRQYFKVHLDLSAMVNNAIAAELPIQEQYDVQSYVLAARGAVNSAVPFSTYKLPETSAFVQEENIAEHQFLNKTRYGSPVNGIAEFPVGSGKFVAIIDNSEQKEDAFPDQYPPSFIIAHDYNPQSGEWQTGAFGFSHYEEAREYLIEHYGVDIGQSIVGNSAREEFIKEGAPITETGAIPVPVSELDYKAVNGAFELIREVEGVALLRSTVNEKYYVSDDSLTEIKETRPNEYYLTLNGGATLLQHLDLGGQTIFESDEQKALERFNNVLKKQRETMTVDEARNAMLDAQEQRQNHYAVRIEDVSYTDPEDGYEGTEPAQVIYIISEHGNIREWKTIPLDSDVFSSDLPNGSLVSYEPVEYEELEEIAEKVKEPIQTYKDVLRAELEANTERRRSEAYYDQRVDDILNEHYRTEYGLFERNIENPKYLSGMLYAEENFRGERVVSLTQNESGKNIAIIAQANGRYAIAEDYHTDDGRNWGKYHLFDNQKSAEEFRTKNFPSATERANQYQALAASKSPLGREYARIKGENADSVVFYRVGDFYEILGADAERVAEKLELTLTGRAIGTEERVPMCGVPYHAINQYADTLAKKGENVIVADGTDIREHKAKIDITEKRLRDYADTLRRNDLEVGNTAQTDEYYLSQAREQIAAYERSDEYRQALREDFPTDFIDDTPQDMAEITQNAPIEGQERKREWLSIELPNGAVGGQYGENTMIKMPKGEFSYYAFYVPTRFLKEADGKTQLRVASDFTFRLNNDGRQVELTGQELKDSFAGKHLDKTYKRVAPSRRYAQGLANLEKNVPAELKAIPTWCCYRTRWNEEKGKKDKFIISPIDGKWTSSKEPGKWVTFDAALKYARENNCEGLSVLLDKQHGITCIDLDKCIVNAETGEMKQRATKLVEALSGTYIERSTSGNGLHIFVKDDILKNGTYNSQSMVKDEDPRGDLEVFDDKRIMSLTGDMYSKGNTLTRAGSAATVYLRQELGERRSIASNGNKPQPTASQSLSDNELIRWIRGSKQGAKFDDLYSGRGVSGDRSNDDGKLAHLLLYFNGGDKEQAFRIMRESGAYRPDKPDSYYRHTIDKMNDKIEVYAKRPTFSADGHGKPKGKGPGNGRRGNQA